MDRFSNSMQLQKFICICSRVLITWQSTFISNVAVSLAFVVRFFHYESRLQLIRSVKLWKCAPTHSEYTSTVFV